MGKKMTMFDSSSREALFRSFNAYTLQRKEELDRHSLKRGSGLLKTYILETSNEAQASDLMSILGAANWSLIPIDEGLFTVGGFPSETSTYLEMLTPRYLAVYSVAPTDVSDGFVRQAVRATAALDHVWLSSALLNTIWQELLAPNKLWRDGVLHYETEPVFERQVVRVGDDGSSPSENDDNDDIDGQDDLLEHRVPRLEIRQRLRWFKEHAEELQGLGEMTGNLTRMRLPALTDRGRYEYYHWGKLTDRGSDFINFRSHFQQITLNLYGRMTHLIEELCSFAIERQDGAPGTQQWTVRGAPVTFTFREPLRADVFARFIGVTFERGFGPFRLWGNPIRLDGPRVHIYGLDLHLWQQIYLDLTPKRFIAVLPAGTCGNTVHRLATNIQRYLDPRVTIMIGDVSYTDLIQRALRDK